MILTSMRRRKAPANHILVILSQRVAGLESMRRYGRLVEKAWSEAGFGVTTAEPPEVFSRLPSSPRFSKWLNYIDKLVLFPALLLVKSRWYRVAHIVDHSDSFFVFALPARCFTILTVHDLFGVDAAIGEERRSTRLGTVYQQGVVSGILRADRLVSVSKGTSGEVQSRLGQESLVVYNPLPPGLVKQIRSGSSGTYFLIVGKADWRKRRDVSIAAWLRLRETRDMLDVDLIVVGPGPTDLEAQLLSEAGAMGHCTYHGWVEDEALSKLYNGCIAVIQLSYGEGFGWPVVEANAHGRPAICSDTEVLREVGAEACVFVNPTTNVDWDRVAREVIELGNSDAPIRNAERFEWQGFVDGLVTALDRRDRDS